MNQIKQHLPHGPSGVFSAPDWIYSFCQTQFFSWCWKAIKTMCKRIVIRFKAVDITRFLFQDTMANIIPHKNQKQLPFLKPCFNFSFPMQLDSSVLPSLIDFFHSSVTQIPIKIYVLLGTLNLFLHVLFLPTLSLQEKRFLGIHEF